MINVIAIDDEPLARAKLRKMIELTPYFTLVASCSSAFEAMKVLEENEVDAIFVDIDMPDLSGLDFVRSLTTPPLIVFTTAYGQFALDGYKVNAVDYLLKPFGQSDFQIAAAKVKKMYDLLQMEKTEGHQVEDGAIEGDILFVKVDYRLVRISINDIAYVEAQSEYIKIVLVDRTVLKALMSLTRMAALLPSDRFIRIHRSFVVNMAFVNEISRMRVALKDGTVVPIGDLYKDSTQQYINERLIGK